MKERRNSGGRDWRFLIFLGSAVYGLLLVGLVKLFPDAGLQGFFQLFGVPALSVLFSDLRCVTAWFDLSAAGVNPQEYLALQMNYPRSIFVFSWLGLSSGTVVWWGWGFLFLYLLGVWLLAGKVGAFDAVVWVIFILSPLSVLLVERANLDTPLFFLVVLAVVFYRLPWVGAACFFLASALKLFPAVGLGATFFSGGKKGVFAAVVAGGAFAVYLFAIRGDLALISKSLSNQVYTSFGAGLIPNLLCEYGVLGEAELPLVFRVFRVAGFAVFFGSVFFGVVFGERFVRGGMGERGRFSFIAGASIYSFLFLWGPQMDYKWVFLLFCLPGVLELLAAREAVWMNRVARGWLFLALGYSYWTFFSNESSLRNATLKQAVAWLLLVISGILLGALIAECRSLIPKWLRKNSG